MAFLDNVGLSHFWSKVKTYVTNAVANKVDKVSGKGLSTNDFTATYKTKLDGLDSSLSNKVDKVSGKGLSTNDFTAAYKTKLDNMPSDFSTPALTDATINEICV